MVKVACVHCETKNNHSYIHCYGCGNPMPKTEFKDKNGFQLFLIFIGNIFKNIGKGLIDNLYLILLVIGSGYFIFYAYAINNEDVFNGWKSKTETLKTLKNISIIVFSGGIFASSLKYLQYLKVFEKEFERVLSSKNFVSQIKESVESITFSKKFLLKQNNLEKIWQNVTLCMYEQQFPELYNELKKNLKNELFKQNNISYYYKNQKIDFYISLYKDDIIKIEQAATMSLIRPSDKLFEWDFKVELNPKEIESEDFPKIEIEFLEAPEIKFDKKNDVTPESIDDVIITKVSKKLSGRREYHMKRTITVLQKLSVDRVWSFGSDRIIDDLDINIYTSDGIQVTFDESMKQKKFIVGDTRDPNKKTYINRGLMLPGEKFKLFFLKT